MLIVFSSSAVLVFIGAIIHSPVLLSNRDALRCHCFSQSREVEDDLAELARLVTFIEIDVLLGGYHLDGLVDQFHRFLPGLIFDVVTAKAQDAILGDLAFLIDLKGFAYDGSEVHVGVGRPGFQALIDLLLGELEFDTELDAFLEPDLDPVLAVKAVENGIAFPVQAILLGYLLEIKLHVLKELVLVSYHTVMQFDSPVDGLGYDGILLQDLRPDDRGGDALSVSVNTSG